jgi:DNA-directed RNA polymerase II subunit RPB11
MQVVFAGYRIPHPLTPMMVVRVQTTDTSNPPNAMMSAIGALKAEVQQLQQQLEMHAPRDPGMQPQQPPAAGGGYGYGGAAAEQQQYGYGGPPPGAGGAYGGYQQAGAGGGYGGY